MKSQGLVAAFLLIVMAAMPVQAKGLLPDADIPQGLEFLSPPPAEGSVDFQRDKELYRQTRAEKGTVRWNQAAFDADLKLDGNAGSWFLDSFGIKIAKDTTPATYALMETLFAELPRAYRSAKKHYMRVRPFVYFKEQGGTCAPDHEPELAINGSYPSGHTARGWGMALVLAEISPERQGAILKRGYEIGQSRVICGVHWQSDVDAARMVSSATVTQMHNSPEFRERLAAAKEEVARIRQNSK